MYDICQQKIRKHKRIISEERTIPGIIFLYLIYIFVVFAYNFSKISKGVDSMGELQTRVDKLQAVLEASKLLNSSKNMEEILDFLLHKSLELIQGGDTGMIFIYNENSKLLEVKAYAALDNSILNLKLMPGESMTGVAFSSKKTGYYKNEEEARPAMMSMRPENMALLEGVFNFNYSYANTKVYGSICCPLIYKGDCLGVIVIDNMNNHAEITEQDVFILEAISVQAAIAIINARNYEKELKNTDALEKYSKLLEEERNKYQYSANIHSKFTEMVLNGADIKEILLEVSVILKKDVFMIDRFHNIENYNFKYFTEVETIQNSSYTKYLSNAKPVDYFSREMGLYLYFHPIIVNRKNLGWLTVVSDNNHHSDLEIITIEKGANILAIELLKINELSNMEQALKGDFLDNLIQNQNKEYLIKCGKNYKFRFHKNHRIIIIELKDTGNLTKSEKDELEFKSVVKYHYHIVNNLISAAFPNSISLIKGNKIVSVIEEKENNKKNIKAFLDKVMSKRIVLNGVFANESTINIRAGISSIIQSTEDFKQAYDNTQKVLQILESSENRGNHYLFYEDLKIDMLLLNNSRETLKKFVMDTLGTLIDGENKSRDLLITLKVYIQSNGNWTYAKDSLHIHGNTLSYRLKRITDLLKVDINIYKERLGIQLALEIYDILFLSDDPDYFDSIRGLK